MRAGPKHSEADPERNSLLPSTQLLTEDTSQPVPAPVPADEGWGASQVPPKVPKACD